VLRIRCPPFQAQSGTGAGELGHTILNGRTSPPGGPFGSSGLRAETRALIRAEIAPRPIRIGAVADRKGARVERELVIRGFSLRVFP